MRPSRKRKLSLDEIGRCHPAVTRKRGKGRKAGKKGRDTRCLPNWVYQKAASAATSCQEGEDHCVVDHLPASEEEKKRLRKDYLRPRRPKAWEKDPDQWLDNFNILHVMKNYEMAFPWFRFLGVFPIDFSAPNPYNKHGGCLNQEVCSLNLLREYRRGTRGIGMVFNLDPHYKGGSHWVALYINLEDMKKPFVGFFDSYGYKTPAFIDQFMRSLTLQVKECQLGYNARRFQYGESECGMFSIYFLICMIHGISFEDFCKDAVHDRSMLELRKVLFSN